MGKKLRKTTKTLFQQERLDGAILMINATDPQIRMAKMFEEAITEKGLPYFIVCNKTDGVRKPKLSADFNAEILYISTLTGKGLDKVKALIKKRFALGSRIIVLGTFNSGKTSLIKRLTGLDLATGKLLGTTMDYSAYPYKGWTLVDSIGWLADINRPNMVSIDLGGCLGIKDKIERVFSKSIEALERTKERALPDIKKVVQIIAKAVERGNKLVVVGAGASGLVAEGMAGLATETGLPAIVLTNTLGNDPPTSFARGTAEEELTLSDRIAKLVQAGDIVVGVSVSGSTGFVYHALRLAKERGAITVGITENLDSFLGEFSDYLILSDAKPEGPSASKTMTSHLVIVHAIILTLADMRGITARNSIEFQYNRREGITKAGGVK